jgi:hypothetical protein
MILISTYKEAPMAPIVPSFADLLTSAVTEPRVLFAACRQSHITDLGNQLLAGGVPVTQFPNDQPIGYSRSLISV